MARTAAASYNGHRFSQAITSHVLWLRYRFSLSNRDMDELLAEHGMIVTYETANQPRVAVQSRAIRGTATRFY